MQRIRLVIPIAAVLLLSAATCVSAQETITYTYDAKGRVTTVARSGGPSQGATTTYTYDKADNRTNVTVANSPNGGTPDNGGGATAQNLVVVVLPLNGVTVLAIRR